MMSQGFYVHYRSGAYTTSTVRGCRASCTTSAQAAADLMGRKLFGCALQRVLKGADDVQGTEHWFAYAAADEWASCQRDGTLDFGALIPIRNTAVAVGPGPVLRQVVLDQAGFHAEEGAGRRIACVPGMSSALTVEEKDAALLAWLRKCRRCTPPKAMLGVVFEKRIRRSASTIW